MELKEAIRLVNNIKWKSTDHDNMEYRSDSVVSVFQLDAIQELITNAQHYIDAARKLDEVQQYVSTRNNRIQQEVV